MKDKIDMASSVLAKTGNKAKWGWYTNAWGSTSKAANEFASSVKNTFDEAVDFEQYINDRRDEVAKNVFQYAYEAGKIGNDIGDMLLPDGLDVGTGYV